jgi:hypothetical protein
MSRRSRAYTALAVAIGMLGMVVMTRPAKADSPPDGSDGEDGPDARPRVGIAQGVTKLSLAFEYAGVGSDHGWRVGGDFEHMLRNRWGLVGSLSLPVSGPWVVPATMGMRVHAAPGQAFDPFVGVAGGFAWLDPTNIPADIVPMLSMRLGATLFSRGIYFLQVDGGYDFVHYSHGGIGFDLSGAVVTGRTGFYF